MPLPDLPLNRRRFLTTAALAAGAAALPGFVFAARAAAAVPPQVTLPDRGIWDNATASAWTDGFLSGNGEYGAVYYGAPTLEKMIFNHHRFVLPNGSRSVMPPVISPYLETARDQALAGDYSGASSTFAHGWSLRWTQTFHPGYELQLTTSGMTTVNDFARITDFRTGEITHTWTDRYGTWKRHVFVSRADQVIVHELLPATGRTVDTTISVNTALAGVPTSVSFSATATVTSGDGYLNLRGTYPSGGAYGYEGVTRVVVSGSGSSVNRQWADPGGRQGHQGAAADQARPVRDLHRLEQPAPADRPRRADGRLRHPPGPPRPQAPGHVRTAPASTSTSPPPTAGWPPASS
ncbi:glycoside hydrolase N-terminal domain-containing protein [Streptomyces sp. UG1]|uniref:glycoside hydrolase N-terminal domain-containing protein n=1 Tax=Streptomyces sp. UG1 TaxID=3417652 RepID=UPI003CE76834